MDEDVFRLPEPEPHRDLATGDGTYQRKPRPRAADRPVPIGMVIAAGMSTVAAVIVGAGWYASDVRREPVVPLPVSAQPVEAPNVVIDLPTDGPPFTAPLCEYRTADRTGPAQSHTVDVVRFAAPKLVLRTDRGRIAVRLNGWAGHCAVASTVSQARAHRLDGVRCRPIPRAKALRCSTSTDYVYRPQLVDARLVMPYARTMIDENGTVHIVPPRDAAPKPVATGKRGGLLTVVADAAGYAGGDLVLAYADTTLPAGSFYPTLGEVDEGSELLGQIGAGLTITSATVE